MSSFLKRWWWALLLVAVGLGLARLRFDVDILDLLPPGVSKGWALERLAARLGVDREETMAIGDNWNDVNMLEWAGQGVMMGNADLELRAMARLRGWALAPPNHEDGVAVVLEQMLARQTSAKV